MYTIWRKGGGWVIVKDLDSFWMKKTLHGLLTTKELDEIRHFHFGARHGHQKAQYNGGQFLFTNLMGVSTGMEYTPYEPLS
jgi:hypothetical protein